MTVTGSPVRTVTGSRQESCRHHPGFILRIHSIRIPWAIPLLFYPRTSSEQHISPIFIGWAEIWRCLLTRFLSMVASFKVTAASISWWKQRKRIWRGSGTNMPLKSKYMATWVSSIMLLQNGQNPLKYKDRHCSWSAEERWCHNAFKSWVIPYLTSSM